MSFIKSTGLYFVSMYLLTFTSFLLITYPFLSSVMAASRSDYPRIISINQNLFKQKLESLEDIDSLVNSLIDQLGNYSSSKQNVFVFNLEGDWANKLEKIKINYPTVIELISGLEPSAGNNNNGNNNNQNNNNSKTEIFTFTKKSDEAIDMINKLQVEREKALISFYEDLKIIDEPLIEMANSSQLEESLWGFNRLYQQALIYKELYNMITHLRQCQKTESILDIFSFIGRTKPSFYSQLNILELTKVSDELQTEHLCKLGKLLTDLSDSHPVFLNSRQNPHGPRSLNLIFKCKDGTSVRPM